MSYIYHYRSPLGGITLASNGDKLLGLWFDGQKYFAARMRGESEEKTLPVFEQTEKWLDIYFSGKLPNFTPPLDMSGLSPFRKRVWEIMLTIPFGNTRSYGSMARQLAEETGKKISAQAVGGAVGHNAISLIIPCHRVVGEFNGIRRRNRQKSCFAEIGKSRYGKFIYTKKGDSLIEYRWKSFIAGTIK